MKFVTSLLISLTTLSVSADCTKDMGLPLTSIGQLRAGAKPTESLVNLVRFLIERNAWESRHIEQIARSSEPFDLSLIPLSHLTIQQSRVVTETLRRTWSNPKLRQSLIWKEIAEAAQKLEADRREGASKRRAAEKETVKIYSAVIKGHLGKVGRENYIFSTRSGENFLVKQVDFTETEVINLSTGKAYILPTAPLAGQVFETSQGQPLIWRDQEKTAVYDLRTGQEIWSAPLGMGEIKPVGWGTSRIAVDSKGQTQIYYFGSKVDHGMYEVSAVDAGTKEKPPFYRAYFPIEYDQLINLRDGRILAFSGSKDNYSADIYDMTDQGRSIRHFPEKPSIEGSHMWRPPVGGLYQGRANDQSFAVNFFLGRGLRIFDVKTGEHKTFVMEPIDFTGTGLRQDSLQKDLFESATLGTVAMMGESYALSGKVKSILRFFFWEGQDPQEYTIPVADVKAKFLELKNGELLVVIAPDFGEIKSLNVINLSRKEHHRIPITGAGIAADMFYGAFETESGNVEAALGAKYSKQPIMRVQLYGPGGER